MRTFAVYEDFVVRETGEIQVPMIGEIGRFKVSQCDKFISVGNKNSSGQKFQLNRIAVFGGDKLPNGLRSFGPINLTKTFELVDISENPKYVEEEGSFYQEISINIKDKSGFRKEFIFYHKIPFAIKYSDYQEYFFSIRNDIQGFQGFREIELSKENREKEVEIERLKQQLNNMKD